MSPELIEVVFKRNRKGFYLNVAEIPLKIGDPVIVEAEKGVDMGTVSQTGRLVMLKDIRSEPKSVLRVAAEEDIQKGEDNRKREAMAFMIGKQYISRHHLNMKLVDVEYQFDTNKLTFYFTSDQRVDFRELVKDLASKYRTRIELRQISVREEARKLGGMGVCGKTMCCSTFMASFQPITTQDAKDQNLPMNPSKLSGTCGRLKCCILFEKGFYESSMKRFPPLDTAVNTKRGRATVDKIDIFNDTVQLRYEEDEYEVINLEDVNRMLKRNRIHN